jgi:HK97 gp10 family phage protein
MAADPVRITVHVDGLEDLERKLYELPTKLAKQYIRRALRAGAAIWRTEIKQTARRRTGWMASQVAITTAIHGSDLEGVANIGVRKKQDPARVGKAGPKTHTPSAANEALWMELGTIKQPARPFIRPAFESKKDAVLARFKEVLKQGLEEIFK